MRRKQWRPAESLRTLRNTDVNGSGVNNFIQSDDNSPIPKSASLVADKLSWRRFGDSLWVVGAYAQNASATSPGGIGAFLSVVPNSLVIDTTIQRTMGATKSIIDGYCGIGLITTDPAGANFYPMVRSAVMVWDSTRIAFASSHEAVLTETPDFLSRFTQLYFTYEYLVPIVGWGRRNGR